MRLLVGTFIMLLVVALSREVQAVPDFGWGLPWSVTLQDHRACPICSPLFERRAFGASATQDGQILDTTADTAMAKAAAMPVGIPAAGEAGLRVTPPGVGWGAE